MDRKWVLTKLSHRSDFKSFCLSRKKRNRSRGWLCFHSPFLRLSACRCASPHASQPTGKKRERPSQNGPAAPEIFTFVPTSLSGPRIPWRTELQIQLIPATAKQRQGSRGGAEREGTVQGGRGRCEASGPAAGAGRGGRRLGVSPTFAPPPAFVRALPCLPVRHDSIQAPLTWEDSTTLLPWVHAHLARCLAPEMDA